MKNWRENLPWPKQVVDDPSAIEYLYEDDEGKTKKHFNHEGALAAMLLAEVVFLNDHWWKEDWPEDAKKTASLNVNTNDIFMWGCADAEEMKYSEIEEVYRYYAKDPSWGTAIWAIIKNKELPQKPVEDAIRKDGIWNLDELKEQHDLRANHYDGISRVMARKKYATYTEWCVANGNQPKPYDAGWWEGWNEYVAANPGWRTQEYEDSERLAINEWKKDNGYEY